MFKRTMPFFPAPTSTRRYTATFNLGLFTPQYPTQPIEKNTTQQIIENKLADPEKFQLTKVNLSKEVVDKLKEEFRSSVVPTSGYW